MSPRPKTTFKQKSWARSCSIANGPRCRTIRCRTDRCGPGAARPGTAIETSQRLPREAVRAGIRAHQRPGAIGHGHVGRLSPGLRFFEASTSINQEFYVTRMTFAFLCMAIGVVDAHAFVETVGSGSRMLLRMPRQPARLAR